MSVSILQKEKPVLRAKAEPVPPQEITSREIKGILRKMRLALASREDGVAIAAPQIGVSLRIFLVSPKAFESARKEKLNPPQGEEKPALESDYRVFINPEIIKSSKNRLWLEEGCLSVSGLYGKALRARKVSVRAHDQHGKIFALTGNTMLSQIFQHEIDHLNGILFTDHAKDLHSLETNPTTPDV